MLASRAPAATRPPARARAGSGRLPVLTALLATFLAASTVPTPLYAHYATRWHLSPAAITVAFGVYALALLAALLVFGRLSDHVGRRPVLLVAIAVQLAGALTLGLAGSFHALLAGRVLQGLATGLGVGAISAAILDVDADRGGVANAAAPLAGSAAGGLLAAVLVARVPAEAGLAYAVLLVALLVEAALVVRLPESAPRRAGAVASLRPSLALPPDARGAFLAAAPVVFAVYALSGLFASLGPAIVQLLGRSDSALLGVLPLVVMNAAAPMTSVLLRHRPAGSVLTIGLAGLVVGVVLAGAGVLLGAAPLFLVGAAVSGVGFGAGFRGGQQLIVGAATGDEHAGAVSTVYVVSYIGFGVPAIAAGVLDTATRDLPAVTVGYCVVLLVLAALAALALVRRSRAARSGR